jgi:8-oxo-dGTP pyrophosphatase MutT (NUDIX family)
MRREFSAGGVLVRRFRGRWWLAAIRPGGKPDGVWALPKGNIDPGERPDETAVREVAEETGITARLDRKLGDTRYTYTWQGERVFKIVSFYLLRYRSGRLGDTSPEHAHEVAAVRWLPLEEAASTLAYSGERSMAERALAALVAGHPAGETGPPTT